MRRSHTKPRVVNAVKEKKEKRRRRRIELKELKAQGNEPMGYKSLIPKKIENKETDLDLRPLMEDGIIPKPLNSIVWVGTTGSGKTNSFMNMMMDENMYKGYFDETYLFSLSAELDPLFKRAGLDKKHMISKKIMKKLDEIIQQQKEEIEDKGFQKAKSIMLIFEDSTGNAKLLKSPGLVYAFTLGRHLKLTIVCMVHKYKSIPPTIRLNASQLCVFPCNGSQQLQLWDDYCPSGMSKKGFLTMLSYAWKQDDDNKRPWFTIDNKNRHNEKRFRKSWHEYLIPTEGSNFEVEQM